MLTLADRLHRTLINAAVSIDGVSIGNRADKSTWRVSPSSLQSAAQPTIDAFDTSEAAERAFEDAQEPLLKSMLDAADQGISEIAAYLVIADSATNAQVRAEVKAIDQRQRAIIRALKRLIQREWRN